MRIETIERAVFWKGTLCSLVVNNVCTRKTNLVDYTRT